MQWLAEHGRHQRPATEMRMDGEVDQRRLLVFVEKIEGIFVDLIKVSRAAPEGAVALRRFYPIPIRYRQDAKRAKKSSVYLGALCAFARDCCYLSPISYSTKAQSVAKKLCYRLLKKMSEAHEPNGVLEYCSIGF
jgi:hypothetical protein